MWPSAAFFDGNEMAAAAAAVDTSEVLVTIATKNKLLPRILMTSSISVFKIQSA